MMKKFSKGKILKRQEGRRRNVNDMKNFKKNTKQRERVEDKKK